MAASVLDGKNILAVDDEPDVLAALEEEIGDACTGCTIDKARSYEEAIDLLESKEYDVVILDIMGVRGFDLLEKAVARHFKVVMLTAHSLSPEAMKKSHDLGASAYLPKEKLGEVVPFLEDVLKYDRNTVWRSLIEKLEEYFDSQFEPDWRVRSGVGYW